MRGIYTKHLILAAGFDPSRLCHGVFIAIGRKPGPVRRGQMIPFRFTLSFGCDKPTFLRMAVHVPDAWRLRGWPHPSAWTGRRFEVIGFHWWRHFNMGLDFT